MDISHQSPVIVREAVQWECSSHTTGRSYRIYTSTPPGPVPEQGYPLLLVTDAELFFASAAVEAQARGAMGDIAAPVIVGIGYGDCDPPAMHQKRIEDFGAIPTGQPSPFCQFLASELLPWIAEQWPIDAERRSIFGFSLGALASLQMLRHYPRAFKRHIAASPALWWEDGALIRAFADHRPTAAGTQLLISWGEDEDDPRRAVTPPGMSSDEATGLVERAKIIRNAQTLVGHIRRHDIIKDETYSFPGENHASVPWLSLSRSLGFALRG